MTIDKRHTVKSGDGRRRGNTRRNPIVVMIELKWSEIPDDIATWLFNQCPEDAYPEGTLSGQKHYTTRILIKE